MMTDEQIIQLAEQHVSYITEYVATGWFADTEDLLKFARAIYKEGYEMARLDNDYDKIGC
jgi:hypothetical protein